MAKFRTSSVVRPIVVDAHKVLLLDQRLIPGKIEYFDATALDDMVLAIKDMIVRGAPAIGVAAALGLAAHARHIASGTSDYAAFLSGLQAAKDTLQASRPTAVNLRWGTDLIYDLADSHKDRRAAFVADELFAYATAMIEQDIAVNRKMGEFGATLIGTSGSVLTHCNAGALATCGWGTALGVVRSARELGSKVNVFVDETRPRQQGARLTTWELMQDGIDATLIADTMAGYLMSLGKIDLVLVGADRIATNGDTANKIGTYTLAVLADAHKIPFYVVAPLSTVDPNIASGKEIPIEERDPEEVAVISGQRICPEDVAIFNPAFDVTPARLITAIVTEAGILKAPYDRSIKAALDSKRAEN